MERYQVILAYDGSGFEGFQRQPRRPQIRTVQGEVESVLRTLGWQGEKILFAGRTDSGVHAAGQVIAFDLDWRHPLEALQAAMNARLPEAIAARQVRLAPPDFHPRYHALSRRYCYRLYCQPVRDPLRDRFAWQVWPAAAPDRLEEAARLLVGTHDFAAFGTPPRAGGSTVRTVVQTAWHAGKEDELLFEITANAFLYHMVRRLVKFQVEIGQGRRQLSDVQLAYSEQKLFPPVGLAQPQGLTLVEVIYPAGA